MKIFFIGDMRSPFIKQDFDLLIEEKHTVGKFDLGEHAKSFWQIPTYILKTLMIGGLVIYSDVLWIWYADYPDIPFILMAKLFHKPVVINLGGYEVYNGKGIGYGNQTKLIRGAVSRWVLRNVWGIIVQSNAYRKIVEELVPDTTAHIFVIPPYIDTNLCDGPMPEKKNLVVTASCNPKNDILKGIPLFNAAANCFSDYEFRVLRNLPREEYIQALRDAKVYCQSSYTEQFGVSVAEAMACGCVPVVNNSDGLPETVGDTGFIVETVDELMAGIRHAMTMDGSKARKRAMAFSKEYKVYRLRELFEGLRKCPI